jgi:NOL1/NOP2/fmu family ribosome biogenesis protein
MALASLKVVCVGLPLVRKVGRRLKPTSAALRLLGHRVTRNRVRLKEGEAEELLAGAEIPWTGDASPGYVLLETEAGVVGCGWLLQGRLLSQIPKSEAASFLCRRTSRNTETR